MSKNIIDEFEDLSSSINEAELSRKLVQRVLTDEHDNLPLIKSWNEYIATKTLVKALRKLVQSYSQTASGLLKDYLLQVQTASGDVSYIVSSKTATYCATYYKIEIYNLKDRIDEFEYYMIKGNFFYIIQGNERPQEDLIDWRKK